MTTTIDPAAQDQLFRDARSHSRWLPQAVGDDTLRALHDLAKWGPTSFNSCPARFLFLRTPESKARLQPALIPQNVDKTLSAPVVAIVAHDLAFYEELPRLFPGRDFRPMFRTNPTLTETMAFRNGTLQGAYLMIAARALGLDCGPMSGFDNAKVDAEFFAGTTLRSNFLCALGHADHSQLGPPWPRLDFDSACQLL
jgi:3-hydroxypropanoate dehydrogenase